MTQKIPETDVVFQMLIKSRYICFEIYLYFTFPTKHIVPIICVCAEYRELGNNDCDETAFTVRRYYSLSPSLSSWFRGFSVVLIRPTTFYVSFLFTRALRSSRPAFIAIILIQYKLAKGQYTYTLNVINCAYI